MIANVTLDIVGEDEALGESKAERKRTRTGTSRLFNRSWGGSMRDKGSDALFDAFE
jgi:hypothetical protein